MSTRTLAHDDIPATYAELVALCMPRPLHDEVDYGNALRVLDAMAGFEMNADQEHHAIEGRQLLPVELLRALMDEHGMSESDLGRLLGDRSLGHRVLAGQRELSKAHIRTLAEHFAVRPAALLG